MIAYFWVKTNCTRVGASRIASLIVQLSSFFLSLVLEPYQCHLRKSYFVLKQKLHAWFGKFSHVIENFGMQKSKSYHCILQEFKFLNYSIGSDVDDIVITESDSKSISSLKSFLHDPFHTKDLGTLKYSLGVKVMRSK